MAKEHGDIEKTIIENIKLEVLQELKCKYLCFDMIS